MTTPQQDNGELISLYWHPGYNKYYPINVVLMDEASQENCDGEPYDMMVAASNEIKRLAALVRFYESE